MSFALRALDFVRVEAATACSNCGIVQERKSEMLKQTCGCGCGCGAFTLCCMVCPTGILYQCLPVCKGEKGRKQEKS